MHDETASSVKNEHAVVVAGGGPTGLMSAAELAVAGTDVAIVEPRKNQELDSIRGRGLHARTIECSISGSSLIVFSCGGERRRSAKTRSPAVTPDPSLELIEGDEGVVGAHGIAGALLAAPGVPQERLALQLIPRPVGAVILPNDGCRRTGVISGRTDSVD